MPGEVEPRGASEPPPRAAPDVASIDAALEEGRALLERLRSIASHGSARDRYRVLSEIGSGGMGRVLRVWDEDLQRELALKELALGDGSSHDERARERLLARFVLEARVTSRLDHPGIVPVHEIGIGPQGQLYFTMPLVRGRDLQEVFALARAEEAGWSLQRALAVLLKVAHTVAFAHSRGVIHRDLKPRNVMVGPFGEVYVMDWGLALVQGDEDGVVVGTPAYMAPETAARGEASERSDVYSLGAMLYEALSGRMPHQTTLEESPPEGRALSFEAPRPLAELGLDLPPELVAVCAKAMAPRPKDRYRSAVELARDLDAWLERRVVAAYATGRWARLKKWRQRNPRLSLALEALCFLALVSVGTVIAIQHSKLRAVAAERAEVERKGYVRNLKAAELSLAQGGGQAALFLEDCPEELRGWLWRHLAFAADSSLRKLAGHGEAVLAVAFRPDGQRLATGARDGAVRLFDPRDGRLVARSDARGGAVRAVLFAPDDALLASASQDGAVRLWDATTGASSRTLGSHDAGVTSLAFAPDGRRLASGDYTGAVRVWDLDGGFAWEWDPASRGREAPALDLLWRDERVFVALGNGRLAVLDARTGEERASRSLGSGVGDLDHRAADDCLAAVTLDEGVVLLDGTSLERRGRLEAVGRGVRSLAFTPDGARIGLGMNDGSLRVWSESGGELAVHHGHAGAVLALASDASGRRFLSGGDDRTARLWDLEAAAVRTLALAHALGPVDPCLRLGPDVVALGRPGGVSIVRLEAPGEPLEIALERCSALALDPAGARLAAGGIDGRVWLHDARDGRSLATLRASTREVHTLLFDPSGERLVTRGLDARLRLWDLGEERVLLELPDPAGADSGAVAFDPSGATLLSGQPDGSVRRIDAQSGATLGELRQHQRCVTAFGFGPGGLLASADDNGLIVVQDLQGRRLAVLRGHDRQVTALCFDPDGERLFSAATDGTVRVWDARRGDLYTTLHCGAFPVTDLAFDAAGDRLVAVDSLSRVHLWATRGSG